MIGSNLVVEGVPGNHHHHHHHHPHHHHHAFAAAAAAAAGHPLHSFSAIHHHLNQSPSSRSHLMSAATFAEPFLKAVAAGGNGGAGPAGAGGGGGGSSLLQASPPEFAHPLPKPAPIVARYNGVTSGGSLNGAAAKPPPPQQRLAAKYAAEPSEAPHVPVNLVQSKEALPPPVVSSPQASSVDVVGHPAYGLYTSGGSRLYQPNPTYATHFAPPPPPSGPYGPLYPPNPFASMLHRGDNHRPPSHLLALQQYPETSAAQPHHLKSPPTGVNGMVKTVYEPPIVPIVASEANGRAEKRFKVPSGKEGSLKHRILTRPEAPRGAHKKAPSSSARAANLLPPPASSPSASAATTCAVTTARNGPSTNAHSPTDAAPAPGNGGRNCHGGGDCATNPVLPKFIKGSLIQLANGRVKKVEDMQTEDFISCVENSSTMRIDPSTVVRILESGHKKGMTTVTLSYGEQRNQVDVESSVEHPYFVVKRGWSSYSPNKTLQIYRLSCHQLQVGDVCLTLSPKASANVSRKSNPGNGGAVGAGANSAGGQRRPNGHSSVAGGPGGHQESSRARSSVAAKKNDLRISSAADTDNEEGRSSNNASCNSSSSSSNSSNNSRGSSPSSQQLVDGAGTKFGRMALANGHDEAKKLEPKATENDNNNNNNSAGDKYSEAPGAKKKRRWSAPDQMNDEHQQSPLPSPPVSVGGMGGAVPSKNNG